MVYANVMTSQQRLILIIAILASFVSFLDGSVVNVALPAISRELGGGITLQQWVVDAYLITLGSLILVAGSLSDIFGRQRILKLGLVGFAVASLLCAVAPSGLVLILARALQGVAGAFLVPSSLALIISAFSGQAQGKAIGTWTAWTGMAFLFGPLLGGFFVDALSWRLVFAINLLPIAVTLGLMAKVTQKEQRVPDQKVDIVGAVLCTLGLLGTVFALIEQPEYGWGHPGIWLPMVFGLAALASFGWYERRARSPMLPFSLFRVRNFSVGNVATTAIYAGLSIATFLIVIFVQQVGGYTALQAGLALLPITILMFFLSPRFGSLAGKFGPRWFMAAGPLVGALGFVLMTGVGGDVEYATHLLPGILVFGLGLSMTVSPLTSAVLGSIDTSHSGIASAVNNMIARVAGLVAVAFVGVVVGSHLDVAGFHRSMFLTAALMAIGGVISAIGIQNAAKPTDPTKLS